MNEGIPVDTDRSVRKRNESGNGLCLSEIETENGLVLGIIEAMNGEAPRRGIRCEKME